MHRSIFIIGTCMNNLETLEDIAGLIDGNFLRSLPTKEFGKIMGIIAEHIVKDMFSKNIEKYNLSDSEDCSYDLISRSGVRNQVKFRHQTGAEPYSTQVYTHNWRQVNQYNVGSFDYITFIMYHANKREPKDWYISVIQESKCIDPKDKTKLLKNIPPKILQEGKNWISILKNRNGKINE